MPFLYFLWHLPNHGTYYTTVTVRFRVSLLQASKDKMSHFCIYTVWHRGWGDWIFINLSLERDLRINSAFSSNPSSNVCYPVYPPHLLNTRDEEITYQTLTATRPHADHTCIHRIHWKELTAHGLLSPYLTRSSPWCLAGRCWLPDSHRSQQHQAERTLPEMSLGRRALYPGRQEACWPKVNAQ